LPDISLLSLSEVLMKRWLLVPLAMMAVLALTPSSQGGGCKSYSCGPTYCVVGYRTETRTCTHYEWVSVPQTIHVTKYKVEKEARKITRYEQITLTEKKPYTYYVSDLVKQTRMEDYYVCVPYTEVIDRPYTIHEEIKTQKTGTRKVSKTVTEQVPHNYTVYEEVRTQKTGTRKVSKMVEEKVPHNYTVYEEIKTPKTGTRKVCKTVTETVPSEYTVDRGHWVTECYDRVCYSRKHGCCEPCCYTVKCYKKCWVPKLEVVKTSYTVNKCVWVDEPYNYTEISHKPIQKQELVTVRKCVWVDEPFTYTECSHKPIVKQTMVTVHKCVWVDEPYTYTECSYKPVQKVEKVTVHKSRMEKKTRPVDFYTCVQKEMKGEHTYTRCEWKPKEETIMVDVHKPFTVEEVIQVKKCVPMQKTYEVKVPVYGCTYPSGCCK